jgi:HAD superfamily hydrolase (TIGR01509 family)
MRFGLIIFDCDGVLVDSEPIVNQLFVDMLSELGYALDYAATLREFSGGTMSTRLAVTSQRLAWSPPSSFVADFNRRLLDAMRRHLRAVPGVPEVLERLPRPWCVVSNGAREDIRFRLEQSGLLDAFEPYLFSSSEVAQPKPAPDVFLHAARCMAAAPENCAVIEDSVTGVRAGARAGMTVFGFARLTSAPQLRQAGACVFEHMSDLPALLEANEARCTRA